jgi:hypothetical protein
MTTKNRPFHVRLTQEWNEELYKAASSVAEGTAAIQSMQDRFVAVFDEMLTAYGAAPATGDWIEFEDADYQVTTRTLLAPGGSKELELWLIIDKAPSA